MAENPMNIVLSEKTRSSWLGRRYFFLPQIVALFILGPLAWLAFDRTPPLLLYDGAIEPNIVHRGQEGITVTWRATFSGRDCPGQSQRELVDSHRSIWPQLARARKGIFKPDAPDSMIGTVVTPPLSIPEMVPGPATYKVTQFYYCNWLQRILHWPIVQSSPYIRFEVAP